ncbi:MAG TPA: non-canonical purine NTP pyrophosphatase [Gemmatimonadaceae bacterium]|nr:non-canonical purine NTP pyrophosphatase [Gemmatimonadaceae bacterium]
MTGQLFLLATRSAGKLRELRAIFSGFGLDVVDLAALDLEERPEEDNLERYDTFEENALAKARYFYERSGGMPTFGDDSGMSVEVLGGEPGVYSKRWSGRDDLSGKALDDANNAKLVARMREARHKDPSRYTDRARYVSIAAFKDSNGEVVRRGEVDGRVLAAPRGDGGFGYDAYFEAPALGGTFAESTIEKTAALSHRARAFQALLTALRAEGRIW